MFKFVQYESEDVPNKPGVYAFALEPISLANFGLVGAGPFELERLEKVKKRLVEKLLSWEELLSSREFVGRVVEPSKDNTNSMILNIQAAMQTSLRPQKLLDSIDSVSDPVKLMRLLEVISVAMPPLYVGVAIDQTLKQRYEQHWNNYLSKRSGCFGGRLREMRVEWSELSYYAVEIPTGFIEKNAINLCEEIVQALSKPILSNA